MQMDGEVVVLAKGRHIAAEKRCLTGAPYGRDEAIGCQISGPTPKGRFHQCSFRWFVGAEGRLSHADDATL